MPEYVCVEDWCRSQDWASYLLDSSSEDPCGCARRKALRHVFTGISKAQPLCQNYVCCGPPKLLTRLGRKNRNGRSKFRVLIRVRLSSSPQMSIFGPITDAQLAVSATGVMAYVPAPDTTDLDRTLVWVKSPHSPQMVAF